eukprot:153044-Alexandrium_andersonii.AAC.1
MNREQFPAVFCAVAVCCSPDRPAYAHPCCYIEIGKLTPGELVGCSRLGYSCGSRAFFDPRECETA